MGYWARSTGLVVRHPTLWWTAARQALRMSRPGWWHRPPFVPRPDPEYLRYRMETQYGPADSEVGGEPDPHDVLVYLRWCRAMSHQARRARR
jgi:hypothetical protein